VLAAVLGARQRKRGHHERAKRADARRVQALAAFLVLGALALMLSACEVSPFCIGCVRGGGSDAGGIGGVGGTTGGASGTSGGAGGAGTSGGADGCVALPQEECNGMDDDCDFRVDEDIEPLVICNQQGLCAGTVAVCIAGESDVCQYPSDHQETQETSCDGVDEDCDGRVDEAFPTLGDACSLGVGACSTAGELECNGAGTGVVCVIGTPNEPEDEICDGIDNDCDGLADEPESDKGSNDSYVRDELVQVAASLWMYKYEASRPDAREDAQGKIGERACSKPDVLPWTNITYDEAVDACEAADMELCTEGQWIDACNALSDTCLWGYTPSAPTCMTYPSDGAGARNGHELTPAPGDPDTHALAATGSIGRCYAAQRGNGRIFDLSGNAKEWVTDDPSIGGDLPDGSNPHRGGSFNNLPGGMRCDFDFAAANNDVRLRNVSFRCCTNSAP
jgi:hypothetical protein